MCLIIYANNKGADQPLRIRSLISTVIVRCLDSMICILAISRVSRFQLASVAEQAGFNHTWSKISGDTFSHDVAQLSLTKKNLMSTRNPDSKLYEPRQANLCLRAFRHDKF